MTLRQPILYAEALWRNQRLWVVMLVLAGAIASPAMLILNRSAGRTSLDGNLAVFLLYLPLGLLYGAGLLYYRRHSAVEAADSALRITKLLRSVDIGYDLIRSVRVQKLELHFLDARKRYIRPISRGLMPQNALFVRLRGDEARIAEVRRQLGAQYVADDMLAIPIPDPDAMAWEITSRLPERTGVNLGGQRRKKRTR